MNPYDIPWSWSPSKLGCFKLKFNGAWKGNPWVPRYGGVLQDHKGNILWIVVGSIGNDTNNATKVQGLIQNPMVAIQCDFSSVKVEGDY